MFTEAHKASLRKDGYCVVEGVLARSEAADVRRRLVAAAAESERRGIPTYIENLDPNANNVRVFNLLDLTANMHMLAEHQRRAFEQPDTARGQRYFHSHQPCGLFQDRSLRKPGQNHVGARYN